MPSKQNNFVMPAADQKRENFEIIRSFYVLFNSLRISQLQVSYKKYLTQSLFMRR